MGTDYTLRMRTGCAHPCPEHCRGPEVHLGRAYPDRAFVFRAHPRGVDGITGPVTTYDQWRALLDLDGVIHDDQGAPVSPTDLLTVIAHASGRPAVKWETTYTDRARRTFAALGFG